MNNLEKLCPFCFFCIETRLVSFKKIKKTNNVGSRFSVFG